MLRILDLPVFLRRKLESTQVSLPYDAVAKIARLPDPRLQKRLVEVLLNGATQREIRDQIQTLTGRPRSSQGKPKRVFSTTHQATVIVQSKTDDLSPTRACAALEEALDKARGEA